jgi:hypothetical protein
VIKDTRENKLETPEERSEKAMGEEGPAAAPKPAHAQSCLDQRFNLRSICSQTGISRDELLKAYEEA